MQREAAKPEGERIALDDVETFVLEISTVKLMRGSRGQG